MNTVCSSPELAEGELLGYRDVRRTCGRPRRTKRPSVNFQLVYTLEGTVLIQSSRNFVRMLTIITSKSISKLGHVGSKTRSLGKIIEKPCVHSRGHSFDHKFMKMLEC